VNFDSDEDRAKFFEDLSKGENEEGTFLQFDFENNEVDIEAVQIPEKKLIRKIKANK